MKVYLQAFWGRMVSAHPWDWPEHTSDLIHLMLDMDSPQFFDRNGTEVTTNVPVLKKATFTWNGLYIGSGPHQHARIYVLTDVS